VVQDHPSGDVGPGFERVFKELFARGNVDAFILTDSAVDDPRVRSWPPTASPFASMGRLAPDLPQQWVDVDNVAGMLPPVDHLVAAGHRTVLLRLPAGGDYWTRERFDGLVKGLAAHDLSIPAANVQHGDDTSTGPSSAYLLQRGKAGPRQVRRVVALAQRRRLPLGVVTWAG
jgi:DNA-binding LacI/PurR family transcriptional regulator